MRVSVGWKFGPWLVAWALIAPGGCTSEEATDVSDADPVEAVDDVEEAAGSGIALTLSDDVARLTFSEAGDFPHGAHGGIVCAQCHTSIVGHDTHETVDCADCHQGSAFLGERVVFARDECLACHHGAEQVYTCERCHASPPEAVVRTENVQLAVWTEPREWTLPFDHTSHETLDCSQCHTGGVLLAVGQGCEACHQDHHQPASNCSTCHGEVPLETHDLDAHLGCAGANCHQDALPLSSERSPTTCLSCHVEQVDHERDEDCATCHRVSPAGAFVPAEEVNR